MGRFIIITGLVLIVIGLLFEILPKIFGRLPGDIIYQKGNFTFIFPLTTMIILSVIATLIFNIIIRFFK